MRCAVFALFLGLPLTAALADVYRSVDAQGHVQYSDTPTPGAELVHVQRLGADGVAHAGPSPGTSTNAGTAAAAAPATPTPNAGTAPKSSDPVRDTLATQAAQQAVAKDLATTRAEQCTKATDDYNSSVQARRIYKTGADGERQYLTDDEADQQRLSLRLAMEGACAQ
jgi:hypothetical protein